MRRALMALIVLMPAAACAAFSGSSSEPGPAADSDASMANTPPTDASQGDASVVTADGAPPDAAANPPAHQCTGQDLFNETFAMIPGGAAGWFTFGAPPAHDQAVGQLQPSLRVGAPGVDDGGRTQSGIKHSIQLADSQRLCIELDVNIAATASEFTNGSFAEVLSVISAQNDKANSIYVEMRDSGLNLSGNSEQVLLPGFRTKRWSHLVLRLPYGGASAVLDDGLKAIEKGKPLVEESGEVTIELGLDSTAVAGGKTGNIVVNYDNFHVTVSP